MKFLKRAPKTLRLIIPLLMLVIGLLCFYSYLAIREFKLAQTIPSPPVELVSEIERTGRDAICEDLIGMWSILGSLKTWEFRKDGRFIETQELKFSKAEDWMANYRIEYKYTCDDSMRTAEIPIPDTIGEPSQFLCCVTIRLGAISEDRMVIYNKYTDREAIVIVRE